jgi:hypothetical protein
MAVYRLDYSLPLYAEHQNMRATLRARRNIMLAPEQLLKGINLETVSATEALAFVQRLTTGTLDKMSSDY